QRHNFMSHNTWKNHKRNSTTHMNIHNPKNIILQNIINGQQNKEHLYINVSTAFFKTYAL
ncbi:hypothetical protein WUBG_06589, partial [Wuchereria bancrofti]